MNVRARVAQGKEPGRPKPCGRGFESLRGHRPSPGLRRYLARSSPGFRKGAAVDVLIKTKNVRLTDGLREYIDKRVAKLDRLNERIIDAKLELRSEKNRSGAEEKIAQFTIATGKTTLRAEEKNDDLRAAIDLAVDRMTRQIQRFHHKKIFARRRQRQLAALEPEPAIAANGAATELTLDLEEDEAPVSALVRRKRFKIQPMGEDEAIEQMELLGHDFFVFFSPDDAQVNVLYRRKDGQYGIIQPDLA